MYWLTLLTICCHHHPTMRVRRHPLGVVYRYFPRLLLALLKVKGLPVVGGPTASSYLKHLPRIHLLRALRLY